MNLYNICGIVLFKRKISGRRALIRRSHIAFLVGLFVRVMALFKDDHR